MKKILSQTLLFLFVITDNCYCQRMLHIEGYNNAEIFINNRFEKIFNTPVEISRNNTKIKLYSDGWIKIKEYTKKTTFNDFREACHADKDYDPTAPCYELTLKKYRDLKDKIKQSNGHILDPQGMDSVRYVYDFVHEEEVNDNYKEFRIALIIGNGDYTNWDYLPTISSTITVAEELRKIGFHTLVFYDAPKDTINAVLQYFMNYPNENKIIKLLYYAGHGMRVDNRDYIIPIDAGKNDTVNSIKIGDVVTTVDSLTQGKKDYNLVFIDACRSGNIEKEISTYRPVRGQTYVINSTQSGKAAYDLIFTNAFIKYIGDDLQIGRFKQKIEEDVKTKSNNNQGISVALNPGYIEKVSLYKEKTNIWVGAGMKAQVPIKPDLPTAWIPYARFGVNNIYLWKLKTQFEIDLGWNVCKKTTPPVYLYNGNNVTYASEFRSTWDVSCRYGPSFDLSSKCSLSAMLGISYHYLRGTPINGMNIDAASTYCFTPTFDCELSYRLFKHYKLSILLGTDILRIPHDNYKPLEQIPFMDKWYKQPNINLSVVFSRLL